MVLEIWVYINIRIRVPKHFNYFSNLFLREICRMERKNERWLFLSKKIEQCGNDELFATFNVDFYKITIT